MLSSTTRFSGALGWLVLGWLALGWLVLGWRVGGVDGSGVMDTFLPSGLSAEAAVFRTEEVVGL